MDVEESADRPPARRPDREPIEVGDAARDIELFTEITGDRNPLHYDEEVAARTLRRHRRAGRSDHALLNAVVAEELPGPGSVFMQLNLRFRAPVRPWRRDHRRRSR